jgi:hypothetical protein
MPFILRYQTIYCDIELDTYGLDASVDEKLLKTKAILPTICMVCLQDYEPS